MTGSAAGSHILYSYYQEGEIKHGCP